MRDRGGRREPLVGCRRRDVVGHLGQRLDHVVEPPLRLEPRTGAADSLLPDGVECLALTVVVSRRASSLHHALVEWANSNVVTDDQARKVRCSIMPNAEVIVGYSAAAPSTVRAGGLSRTCTWPAPGLLRRHRDLLRLPSRAEGRRAEPDPGSALRVTARPAPRASIGERADPARIERRAPRARAGCSDGRRR